MEKGQGEERRNPGEKPHPERRSLANSTPPQHAMYPALDRPAWQQPAAYPERASPPPPPPQSQPGWFPLQDAASSASSAPQHVQTGWTQDGDYAASAAQTPRAYASAQMYAAAPPPVYVWTGEQPASVRASQFLPSPTYPRPLALASADAELYDRQDHKPQQTVLRRNKQIAIGRWNSEEHQWFLKGLEMFQGPAWGEIARLIGSRTSTQVRTHAQKFFTKLARLNQTMPYFEVQIQKERARLVAQGASVTPTAQSASSLSVPASLSPRKRPASASTSRRKQFKDEPVASPTYAAAARYPQEAYDTKPRVYTGAAAANPSAVSLSGAPAVSKECSQQWTSEDGRQWPLASPTSTTASLQLTQLHMDDGAHAAAGSAAPEAESLPSMTKLLYRSAA